MDPNTPNEPKNSSEEEELLNIFYKWIIVFDKETFTLTIKVSDQYFFKEEDFSETVTWSTVLVLPFPQENLVEDESGVKLFAGSPKEFHYEELSKRLIPLGEFVKVVTEAISTMNDSIELSKNMELLEEDSEWLL